MRTEHMVKVVGIVLAWVCWGTLMLVQTKEAVMLGDRLIALAVGVIDIYLVVLGVGWMLNGGGGIGLALAGLAAVTGMAAFRFAIRGGV